MQPGFVFKGLNKHRGKLPLLLTSLRMCCLVCLVTLLDYFKELDVGLGYVRLVCDGVRLIWS